MQTVDMLLLKTKMTDKSLEVTLLMCDFNKSFRIINSRTH